ncbi:MAG: hypothetical protein EOO70_04960 [Myxococcaceae bacterium]|nr:MAG: hypothetical protein EOO70_04960 [Myxococcaceae bacterium]
MGDAAVLEFSREHVAAHEAGHAVVALACGIQVRRVEVHTTRINLKQTRHGWTDALEDIWMDMAPISRKFKLIRRIALKAGGLAGECVAEMFDSNKSFHGAKSDIEQIGGALCELGLLEMSVEKVPAKFIELAVCRAFKTINANLSAFAQMRKELLVAGFLESPKMEPMWTDDDDRLFLAELVKVKP